MNNAQIQRDNLWFPIKQGMFNACLPCDWQVAGVCPWVLCQIKSGRKLQHGTLKWTSASFGIIHFLRGMLHTTEMLNRACEWSAMHECTIYENNMQEDMETRRLKLVSLSQGDFQHLCLCLGLYISLSLSARRTRNRAEDVIQCLPIKWCPEACLTNAANLCIFRDSSLAALVEVGGRPLYLLYGSADSAAAEQGQLWWTAAD